MPKLTLYIKDSDEKLIEKARKQLGDSLSSVFVECVQSRLEEVKPTSKGAPRKITLELGDPPIKKSFMGTWIVGNAGNGIQAEADDSGVSWDHRTEYSIALTQHGRLVVYEYNDNRDEGEMRVFEDFAELKEATVEGYPVFPQNIINEVATVLGKSYEVELDI